MRQQTGTHDKQWLDRVRARDFSAIPVRFTWAQSAGLAPLINGYEIAGGVDRLAAVSCRVLDQLDAGAKPPLDALDLWLTLFWQHRGYRHQGYPPTPEAERKLDALSERLRLALMRASPTTIER